MPHVASKAVLVHLEAINPDRPDYYILESFLYLERIQRWSFDENTYLTLELLVKSSLEFAFSVRRNSASCETENHILVKKIFIKLGK